MVGLSQSIFELFFGILIFISGAILAVVMLAVALAWGLRWGGTWLIREISKDPEVEEWLKRIFNRSA